MGIYYLIREIFFIAQQLSNISIHIYKLCKSQILLYLHGYYYIMTSIENQRKHALQLIPQKFSELLRWLKTFETAIAANDEVQCYAFSKMFAVTAEKYSESQGF